MTCFEPRAQPVREHLENGGKLNPHGHGWAVQSGLIVIKGRYLELTEAVETFIQARRTYPYGWAIFHSRHSTTAPGTLENCQPLALPDGRVFAHNGGLFPVDGDVSDTRIFAEQYLPRWDTGDVGQMAELARRIGQNKMIIMGARGEPLILNERRGNWLNGAWHSNFDWDGEDFHLAAGQCAACGRPMPGAAEASVCSWCQIEAQARLTSLMTP